MLRGLTGNVITNVVNYLLRDRFTADSDPAVDASVNPGKRDVTGNAWYINNNVLFGGSVVGEDTWGDSQIAYTQDDDSGFSRVAGRTLWALIRIEDRQSPVAFLLSTDSTPGDPSESGYGLFVEDGSVDIITPSSLVDIGANIHDIRPMLYLVAITLLDTGACVLLSAVAEDANDSPGRTTPWEIPAYPSATIAYITNVGTDTTFYPLLSALSSPNAGEADQGHQATDIRIADIVDYNANDALADFADRFTRANTVSGIGNGWVDDKGTTGIQSNSAYFVSKDAGINSSFHSTDSSDGIFVWNITTPASDINFKCCFRRTGAGNYLCLTNNGDTRWALHVISSHGFGDVIAQSGVLSDGSTPFEANSTYQVVVRAVGNKYHITVNDIPVAVDWLEDANDYYVNGIGIGIGEVSGNNETLFNSVAAYPITVTLPNQLQQAANLSPFQKTPDDIITSDTFTAANDTELTDHNAAWIVPLENSNATIQGNKLSLGGTGQQIAVQSVGTLYHQCSVDITPHEDLSTVFIGIVCSYKDTNNWFVVRLAADVVLQPTDDEVEVMRCIDGVVEVVGKTQLAKWYTDGSHPTVTLSTQNVEDPYGNPVTLVFLDGHYILAYYLPEEVLGTYAGVYRHATDDDGGLFDNFTVHTLA